MNSPCKWKNADACRYISSLNVPKDGVVCQTCRRDISRVLLDPQHTPRWAESRVTEYCVVVGCTEAAFSALQRSGISDSFTALGLESTVAPIPTPTPLCQHHYHKVYQYIQPIQRHCITCGSALRRDSNPKLCPNPEKIQKHLEEHAGFEGKIGSEDKVCHTCYRSHLFIIQEDKNTSHDCDLQELISELGNSLPDSVQTVEELVELSLKSVAIDVGKELLNRGALLLPDTQDMFISVASASAHQLQGDVEITKLVTSQYILSYLTCVLRHHMVYECKVRKFGTLLYRPGSDLTRPLTQALWKVRQAKQASPQVNSTKTLKEESAEYRFLAELNLRACKYIQSFLSHNTKHSFELSDTSIRELIAGIDPILWESVGLLTNTPGEKANIALTERYKHTRVIRRFFVFCAMMFCINDNFTIPMHTLLTSIIDGQGGSASLIRVLNRLGVCASKDTLERHIQQKHADRDTLRSKYLDSESFTIVSADNIDFRHSYARISNGTKNSSWHGTSIQVVQPLPSLSIAPSDQSLSGTPIQGSQGSHSLSGAPTQSLSGTPIQSLSGTPIQGSHSLSGAPTQSHSSTPIQGSQGSHSLSGAPTQSLSGAPIQSLSGTPIQGSQGSHSLSGTPTQSLSGAPIQSLSGTPIQGSQGSHSLSGTPTQSLSGTPIQGSQGSNSLSGAPIQSLSGTPIQGSHSLSGAPTQSHSSTPIQGSQGSHSLSGTPTQSLSGAPIQSLSGTPTQSLSGAPIQSLSGTPIQGSQGSHSLSGAPTQSLSGTPMQGLQSHASLSSQQYNPLIIAHHASTQGSSQATRKRKHNMSSSPPAKRLSKPRTGTEYELGQQTESLSDQHPFTCMGATNSTQSESQSLSLSDFLPNTEDKSAMTELKSELHTYLLMKTAAKQPGRNLIGIQDYFSCSRATHTEQSNYFYLNIMDCKADSKDTLMSMLHDLYDEFIATGSSKYLVVEGDAKLYELLQSLKREYNNELAWLIPYPGDWHMLMNFQLALMKPYYDAGLKSLAEAAGYPVEAIKECTQFKRTHNFILEAWEALYRVMMESFITASAPISVATTDTGTTTGAQRANSSSATPTPTGAQRANSSSATPTPTGAQPLNGTQMTI